MSNRRIFIGILFVFGLGISLASGFNAKLLEDVERLYNSFIAVVICFSGLFLTMGG